MNKEHILQLLAKILEDNVNQKITVALANGFIVQLDQELKKLEEISRPTEE